MKLSGRPNKILPRAGGSKDKDNELMIGDDSEVIVDWAGVCSATATATLSIMAGSVNIDSATQKGTKSLSYEPPTTSESDEEILL